MMKKILLTLTSCLLSLSNIAQKQIRKELEKAYGEEKYNFNDFRAFRKSK